ERAAELAGARAHLVATARERDAELRDGRTELVTERAPRREPEGDRRRRRGAVHGTRADPDPAQRLEVEGDDVRRPGAELAFELDRREPEPCIDGEHVLAGLGRADDVRLAVLVGDARPPLPIRP